LVPVAVSVLLTVPHRYELFTTLMTWPAAQTYCKMNHTDLAIILSNTDWLRLKKEAKSKRLATLSYVWVGLWNDVYSWRWSIGELPLKSVTYTNWLPGEPNNGGGKESCGSVVSSAQWVDISCSGLRPFICYDANFNVSAKFILITSPVLSWLGARAYCRQYHTDLASALNSSDSNMLYQLVPPDYTFIGLYRDTWKWTDGTNASIVWPPGQPDNYNGNENCGIIINFNFYDVPCNFVCYFFCHTTRFTGAAKFISVTSPVLSWLDARAYCRQYHTDLASALSSSDQQTLNQLITSTRTWIGLYRDTWKWTDGTNATNLPWLPGQPDNYYGNENNAIVLNDQLSDIPASFLYYFYCFTNFPTRSQIIRLQVKSDGSVFDHAVPSSILNQ
ncbi:macrophage mannose receptor 1-like isoform X6, partial [Clarias magur]